MRDITPTLRLQHYDLPAMDKAHHRFTALLGALPLVSHQALPCLLGNLIRTVREHCDQEERFMLATDYKDYGHHRAQHQQLLSTLEHHQHQLELGMELDPLDIHTLLCSWQDEHQQRWDDPLASHLRHATCWKTSQQATAAA
ncbi:bacteriohemerythrin [Marinospirillum alkaliphilum]|uniref:Hemerythrin n=1 Tax=Marinospirillum alkaliphilum DSM 21637 TaxID=1122209 RepID=A0A1K1YIE5_9GAMM|nr:hemerythrin family protein [Marinospirillum alkaliphilum]SFX61181.1 Hemerythrin [Marinospirillum alkaliphilum DSM 21637]